MARVDLDFPQLKKLIGTLDGLLDEVAREIEESDDPDGMGVFDRGEAIVGLGFVACQNYLVARKGKRDKSVYDDGPIHGSGLHIARVVNEGANYWKHHPEWPPDVPPLKSLQRRSYDVLLQVGVWDHSYKMTNLLYELVRGATFALLMPRLDEWRKAIAPGEFIP